MLELTWPLLTGTPSSYPEFLTPAPRLRRPSLADELDVLAATPPAAVRASLARVYADHPRPAAAVELAASPRRVLARVADELLLAHQRLLAPSWSSVQSLLDADVAGRALQLAGGGAAAMLAGPHPHLRCVAEGVLHWTGGAAGQPEVVVEVAPGGVVLLPSAFVGDEVVIRRHTSSRTTVRYALAGRRRSGWACTGAPPHRRPGAWPRSWAVHARPCSPGCRPRTPPAPWPPPPGSPPLPSASTWARSAPPGCSPAPRADGKCCTS